VAVDLSSNGTYIMVPTTIQRSPQHFNKTTFSTIPNVILSMIGYSVSTPPLPTVPFGLRIVITGVTLLNFTYNITTYGCAVFDLHYLYLAIQYDTSTFYMAIVSQTCKYNSRRSQCIHQSRQFDCCPTLADLCIRQPQRVGQPQLRPGQHPSHRLPHRLSDHRPVRLELFRHQRLTFKQHPLQCQHLDFGQQHFQSAGFLHYNV
jgi:hypothetical protein